jgi:hypothetical protein
VSSLRDARLTTRNATSVVSFVSECCFESCSGLSLLVLLLRRLLLQLLMMRIWIVRFSLVQGIAKPFQELCVACDGSKGAPKLWPPSNLRWHGWTMIVYSTNLCRVCFVDGVMNDSMIDGRVPVYRSFLEARFTHSSVNVLNGRDLVFV